MSFQILESDVRMNVGIAATTFWPMPSMSPFMEAIISSVRNPPFATENLLRISLAYEVRGLKFTEAEESLLSTVFACHKRPMHRTMMQITRTMLRIT